MSKKLQVLLTPTEFSQVKKASSLEKKSISNWVRNLIRSSLSHKTLTSEQNIIQQFQQFRLPAPPIDQMLKEIEKGRF